jgi:hypothetical protein
MNEQFQLMLAGGIIFGIIGYFIGYLLKEIRNIGSK